MLKQGIKGGSERDSSTVIFLSIHIISHEYHLLSTYTVLISGGHPKRLGYYHRILRSYSREVNLGVQTLTPLKRFKRLILDNQHNILLNFILYSLKHILIIKQ